jgi:hypothetical protein
MKIKTMMTIKAIVVFFFGLGFIFVTKSLMSIYGMSTDIGGIVAGKLLGQMYLVISLLLWLCRNSTDNITKSAFARGITIGDAVGTAVSLWAVLSGGMNWLGWSAVVIYLFFTIGFGYFVIRPEAA